MSEQEQRARAWRRWSLWLLAALVLIAIDQLTKQWVAQALAPGERVAVLPFFDLTLLLNRGAAFSFLADAAGAQRWFFLGLAVVVSAFILRWLYTHGHEPRLCAALCAILAGALGNAIDRLLYGEVRDFLLFYWHHLYFPAFNVADVSITCGAVLLVLDELVRARRARRT